VRAIVQLPVDFGDPAVRRRLTQVAIRAYVQIVGDWHLKLTEAAVALMGLGAANYYRWRRSEPKMITEDQLMRIS